MIRRLTPQISHHTFSRSRPVALRSSEARKPISARRDSTLRGGALMAIQRPGAIVLEGLEGPKSLKAALTAFLTNTSPSENPHLAQGKVGGLQQPGKSLEGADLFDLAFAQSGSELQAFINFVIRLVRENGELTMHNDYQIDKLVMSGERGTDVPELPAALHKTHIYIKPVPKAPGFYSFSMQEYGSHAGQTFMAMALGLEQPLETTEVRVVTPVMKQGQAMCFNFIDLRTVMMQALGCGESLPSPYEMAQTLASGRGVNFMYNHPTFGNLQARFSLDDRSNREASVPLQFRADSAYPWQVLADIPCLRDGGVQKCLVISVNGEQGAALREAVSAALIASIQDAFRPVIAS